MTTSFFNGESTFPENNTTDQLIDALKAQLAQTSAGSQAAISAGIAAAASASNAAIAEENVAGLSQQATDTLTAANTTLSAAQDATATATTASATATTKAAEAANSAVSAASSLTSVQNTVAPFLSPQAQYVFTATAGQTQWTPPAGVTFVPGIAQVFVNGVRWNRGESYDDSTGTQITFVNGLTLGFTVTVLLSLTALYPVTGVSSADTVGFLGANGAATTVSNLASAATGKGADLVAFKQSGAGAVARTVQDELRDHVSVKQFGAKGDGVTDDTAALSAAITFALGKPYPPKISLGSGQFVVSSPLPDITGPITLEGDNPRSCQILCSGASNIFNVRGGSTRSSNVILRNMGINGSAMTGGFAVAVDWAQNVTFDTVLFNDPYNGVSIRQAGNTQFINCLIDKVRGTNGVYAYGSNAARNGENDQIDIIIFTNTVIQSGYVAGGAAATAELLVLDGRVQTVQFDGLRLLNALRGLVTKNTPGLAANLVPRFLTGSSLEIENMYAETMSLQAFMDVWLHNLFAAGSYTADGIKLSAGGNFRVTKGSINSNNLHGLNQNGAQSVVLTDVDIFNNSVVGSGVKSAIYVSGAGLVEVRGGLSGYASWMPAYTEKQKYGVDVDPAFSGILIADGVDFRGNVTGPVYSGGSPVSPSRVANCPGFNPAGVSLVTVGPSPFSYKAGLSSEQINLYGGSGVVSTVNTVAVANTVPAAFTLAPLQSVLITYSTAPTMVTNKA